MKTLTILLSIYFLFWGRTGHYVTGEIAEQHLTENALEEVTRILRNTTLPESTVWMDQIRPAHDNPDGDYYHTRDWHFVTVPLLQTYEESEKNPNGDIIQALERKIAALKKGGLSEQDELEKLKMVIHMVGDIHQPLHVGTGDDRGGNEVRVHYMGQPSNLHRVWDTNIINSYYMDYEQLAKAINHPTKELIREWQNSTVRDWANESMSYRDNVYDLPDGNQIEWEYRNSNFHIVEKRLLQAGIRLAGVLNDIYDNRQE
ncbi:S1/P1 nuclease [soil metagenome]